MLVTNTSIAQKIDCSLKIKDYKEFVDVLDFEKAFTSWEIAKNNCPKHSEELYIDGQKIIQNRIDNTSTPVEKEKLVRLAMKTLDQYNKFFPLTTQDFEINKAILLINNNIDSSDEIVTLLNNGFKNAPDKVKDANAIFTYFKFIFNIRLLSVMFLLLSFLLS